MDIVTFTIDGKEVKGFVKTKVQKMSDVKLIPRRLGKIELEARLAKLVANTIAEVSPSNMLFQSCIVCEHFNNETEICAQFNVRPPARIIVFGCVKYTESSHIDGDIPF